MCNRAEHDCDPHGHNGNSNPWPADRSEFRIVGPALLVISIAVMWSRPSADADYGSTSIVAPNIAIPQENPVWPVWAKRVRTSVSSPSRRDFVSLC